MGNSMFISVGMVITGSLNTITTKLADNLVIGCDEEDIGHKWWLEFDDVDQSLIYSPKINILQQFVSVGTLNNLQKYFDDEITQAVNNSNDVAKN